ncbi:MAG: family 78 glycoside hydrolase catalytic domain [Clostridia bacterium]|nr:family 78 glycoside hydrolase catalytic domain [Clostridia bacterium]
MKQYIAATTAFNELENYVCAPLFKKTFDYDKKVARLEISVVGIYRLWVNGTEITKGWLAPYFSNPNQVVYYDEYDVSALLKGKDNAIVVLLGNGFVNSNSHDGWGFDKASYRAAPKFYLGLYDGENRVLTTDESWTAYDSPIIFDDYRNGEWYDARKEEELFTQGRKPLLVNAPTGLYKKCESQSIKTFDELKPVKITPSKKGYLYDFGRNDAGVCRLSIDGKAGQKIVTWHGEIVHDGVLDMTNLMNIGHGETQKEYVQKDVYICKDGKQTYTPSFVYHGFRYVYVEGITAEQATEDLLTFLTFHNDMPVRGHFACSNETINKVQACAVQSALSNFHHFPTDCPHREKNGWTGDAVLSAEYMYYNIEPTASFREWLVNIRGAQKDGAFPGIVPTDAWGYAWGGGMGWDNILVELPYQMYRFTGNTEYVAENIDALERYLDFIHTKITDEGLIDYGLGEWVEIGGNNWVRQTPTEVANSLNYIDFMAKAAFLFDVVGKAENAQDARQRQADMIAAFRKKYVKDGMVACKTQTAQTLALAYGVFTEEEQPQAYERLKSLIERDNDRIKVGCFGLKYIFDQLSERGNTAKAVELIANPRFPSHGYWVEKCGFTTLPEGFQEYEDTTDYLRRKDGESFIVSLNHHFLGSVSAWFYKALAGIHVLSADEIRLAPKFDCGLDWVEADFENGGKKIAVRWERQGDEIAVTVENNGFIVTLDVGEIVKTETADNKTTYYIKT